jgi:hypothetical protein
MFGKPEWFQKKQTGWGLRPVSWRGRLYAMTWCAVVCLPFVGLLAFGKPIESVVWVVVMLFAMLWDVQQLRRQIDVPLAEVSQDDDVLIIDDDTEPGAARFATRSFDLHLRR